MTTPQTRRRPAALTIVLAFVMVFFVAILAFVWVATKRANPVMLDQRGNPTGQTPAQAQGERPN